MVDISKLSFYSELNYLKRGLTGSQPLTLGAAGSTVTHTVAHNLGYIPFFVVGAELSDVGTIWSNNEVHVYTDTNLTGNDLPVQLDYWCTTSELTIQIRNGDGSLAESGDRTVYWVIYLDYGDT